MLGHHHVLDLPLQHVDPVVHGGARVHAEAVRQHQQEGDKGGRGVGQLASHLAASPANGDLISDGFEKENNLVIQIYKYE